MSLAVRRYSESLVDVCCEENCLDEVYEQFRILYEQIKSNKEFKKLITESFLSSDEKKDMIENVLKDGNIYLLNFLKTLADRGHLDEIEEMFLDFERGYKERNNILEAKAVTAVAMTEEQVENVKNSLKEKYGKTIVLETSVDPSIIGGMVLYVGNKMLDASIKAKFEGLKKHLKTIELQ